MAAGHMAVDLCQAAVPALLPFFVFDRHYGFAAAAGLVLAQTLSSSVIQPLFGYLADRRSAPGIMPAGVALAAISMALAPFAASYPLTWLAVAVSGLGIAAFHPEGARYARYAAGRNQGQAMSVFSVGGQAGFAAGPILLTPILLRFGLNATWAVMLLPLGVAAAILFNLGRIEHNRVIGVERAAAAGPPGRSHWSAFARLTGVMLARTIVFYGLNTFIPLYWISVLGQGKGQAGLALSVLLISGVVGTVLGGRLGDRFGTRRVVVISAALVVPLLCLLVVAGQPGLALAGLVPLALAAYASSSLAVILGQDYLPARMGTAAGVTLGLSFSLGGIFTPVLGAVGDRAGLRVSILVLAAVQTAGFLCALSLPRREQPAPER